MPSRVAPCVYLACRGRAVARFMRPNKNGFLLPMAQTEFQHIELAKRRQPILKHIDRIRSLSS